MTDTPESVNLSDVSSRKVDTELLNELRDLFARAEDQKERYDFTWNGKAKAYFEAATPITKTLRPQPEESYIYADDDYKEKVNTFNDSENMFITGDNLEALKLLQESYLGKIDMIYIDPPYNTGKDFVYHDNFKSTQKDTDVAEGSVDEDGNRLVKNEKNSGRYHSDWLSMMYPRLKLARNLLSDSGVIFVSIDDNEQANLKLLMDEVFGEDNFVNNFIWVNNLTGRQLSGIGAAGTREFILVYAKNSSKINEFYASFEYLKTLMPDTYKGAIKDIQKDAKGDYVIGDELKNNNSAFNEVTRPNLVFDIYYRESDGDIKITEISDEHVYDGYAKIRPHKNANGVNKYHAFRWSKNKILNEKDDLEFVKTGNTFKIFPKRRNFQKSVVKDIITNINTASGGRDINALQIKDFDFPKPVNLIELLINISVKQSGIVLDFFAGSGTTAQAVMSLNKKDNGNRKYILTTLDENIGKNNSHITIDQISRERIRRAAKNLGDTSGFRALTVDKTGLKEDVFKTAGELTQENLLLDVDNQADTRSDYDLLYDVLVDGALEYNRQIATETINNEPIIKYDYLGELSGVIAYFGDNLTNEFTREIAKLKPLIAVFKESTFNKSSDKVNVLEQFRVISPETKVKVI